MPNSSHLEILERGVEAWNSWREHNPEITPDLREAHLERRILKKINLQGAKLNGAYLDDARLQAANFDGASLHRAQLVNAKLQRAHFYHAYLGYAYLQNANLNDACLINARSVRLDLYNAQLKRAQLQLAELISADLWLADLTGACLDGAKLTGAYLTKATLRGASLRGADLQGAYLWDTKLNGADLKGANLIGAVLRETDVAGATLSNCKVYSTAVWDVKGEPKEQENLVISRPDRPDEPEFTVDKLEIAHFIYMIRHHEKLREVIRESTSKVVLILGRFTVKRRKVLEAVQDKLRTYTDEQGNAKYIPVMFNFPPAGSRDLMETVQILAGLSRFVIADLSDAKGVLVELTAIVPHWEVPVKLIVGESQKRAPPTKMLDSLTKYRWIDNEIHRYCDSEQLCEELKTKVVGPLEKMVEQLQKVRERGFTIADSCDKTASDE